MRKRDAGLGVIDDGSSYSLTTGAPPAVGPVAEAFLPRHFTRGKDGAPSEHVPSLTKESDRGDGMAAIFQPSAEIVAASPVDPKPDGPRYAAMGDAVTVNVLEWVGVRLMHAMRDERWPGQ